MEFKQYHLKEQQRPGFENFSVEGGRTVLKDGSFESPNFKTGEKGWKVNSEGEAEFADVSVGGSSIARQDIFGDGSDGDGTISVNTTLTTDKFYDDLTINSGITLTTVGYRIFSKGILTNNGTIANNGGNGGNGAVGGASGGAAGSAGA